MSRLTRRVLRCCCRGSCLGLNLLLLVTAALQSLLLLGHHWQQQVPLPAAPIQSALRKALPDDQWQPAWDSLRIDLAGNVLISGFTLHHRDRDRPAFRAEHLFLRTSLLRILLPGGQPIREVAALDAAVIASPQLSPSGIADKGVHFPYLALKPGHDRQVTIPLLHAQINKVNVFFRSVEPIQIPEDSTGKQTGSSPLLRSLWRLPLLFPKGTAADCRITPSPHQPGAFSLAAVIPDFPHTAFSLSRLHLHASLRWSAKTVTLQNLRLQGDLRLPPGMPPLALNADHPTSIRLKAGLYGSPVSLFGLELPSRLQALATIRHPELPRPWIAHVYSRSSDNPFALAGSLHQPGTWLGAQCDLSLPRLFRNGWPTRTADWLAAVPDSLPLRLLANQPGALSALRSWLPQAWPSEQIAVSRLSASGTVSLPTRNFQGSLQFHELDLPETTIPYGYSPITCSPQILSFPGFAVRRSPDEKITGTFAFRFPSQSYHFHGQGRLLPEALDPFLGDWWTGLFRNIRPGSPPRAHLSLRGKVGDGQPPAASLYIRAAKARLNEVLIPRLDLSIETSPRWAWIQRLYARLPSGTVSGELAWLLGNPPDARRPLKVNLQGTLPFATGLHLCGLQPPPNLRVIGTPGFHAEGILWRRSRTQPRETPLLPQLRIHVQPKNSEILYHGLTLRKTRLLATVSASRLRLTPITASLADGILSGSITIELPGSPKTAAGLRSLDLQVLDASYPDLTHQLSSLLKDPAPLRNALLKNKPSGRMDLTAQLSGPAGPSTGKGTLSIRNGDIAQVHLLGGLSAGLSRIGLGFSTMGLTDASLRWTWQEPLLQLNELSIRGSVLHIAMDGQLDLDHQTVYMNGRARLFKGMMRNILSPVSQSIGLSLEGPLHDPRWSFSINPLRWLADPPPDSRNTEGPRAL